ncbi:MAG TPA: alpha/beta fold hydrolase, partial [Bdellovibrio sp.]|nr:alpha/beta fold hydrolase [Bdellovibrio sp.]
MKFFLVMTVFAFSSWAQAKNVRRIPSSIKSFDGFSLPYSLEVPEGMKKEDVKSVVVFVHGSGPNDMNEDLSDGSVPKGVQNLVFKDISDALLSQGIATVRYNKRSYEITVRLERDPKTKESQEYKNLMAHPFKYYIDDLAAVVDFAHKEFPNAKMNILGHSEGTGVAIYVASKKSFINGVCLIGFSNESTEVNLFEQIVYRSLHIFDSLDINHDGVIDSNELNANNDTAKAL